MRAVLIDDERLALIHLGKLLTAIGGIEIAGQFQSAEQAIAELRRLQPDVLFIDIHMPDIDGMSVVGLLEGISPRTAVVMVTGDSSYAVEAFERQVLDYILKPINEARLRKTIERLQGYLGVAGKSSPVTPPPSNPQVILHCMGSLRVRYPDRAPEPLKWRSAKIKSLFAYLLHHRGRLIHKNTLLDLFWPGHDEQKGLANLQTSIYRIKKIWEPIGTDLFSITYAEHGYILHTQQLKIDAVQWEQEVSLLPTPDADTAALHRKVLIPYPGDYMAEENEAWAESERMRLKALWTQHALQLGKWYEENERIADAADIYRSINAAGG
ncbi:response regulator [Paenibacillus sp. 1P07SE]|uniref:response regulator n=1 Tax=Paenibacillus sp. 1P07SE TaxID=3132209 RepID=UPI0039A71A74